MADKVFYYFHAHAYALTAQLQTPFEAQIKPQAYAKLMGDSRKILPQGEETKKPREKKTPENYFSEHYENYRHETIFSFSAAHTQVSGHKSRKHEGAFVTLATSEVRNLNVLNVVTADRVVAQISTTHFPDQYSPEVTFIGTQFENLRIGGRKVVPVLKLDFAGKPPKPKADAEDKEKDKYYPTSGSSFMQSLGRQYEKMRWGLEEFLKRVEEQKHREGLFTRYDGFSEFSETKCGQLQDKASAAAKKDAEAGVPVNNGDRWEGVTCSLVEQVEFEDDKGIEIAVKGKNPGEAPALVIAPPAHCFGHVIHVPDFGTIFLAELTVNHNSFQLTMIRTELGCIADGSASMVVSHVNGTGHP